MPRRGVTVSLKFRLLGIVVVLLVLCLWFLTVSLTDKLETDMRKLIETQELAVVSYIADDLDASLSQKVSILNQNAKVLSLFLSEPDKLASFFDIRLGLKSLFPAGLALLDENGHQLAEYNLGLEKEPVSLLTEYEFFTKVMQSGGLVIGRPHLDELDKQAHVAIAVPYKNALGEIKGVLAGFALLSDKNLFGQVERIGNEDIGSVFVVDSRYNLIVSSSNKQEILQPFSLPTSMIQRLLTKDDWVGFLTLNSGEKHLVAAKSIPHSDWIVLRSLPISAVYQPIQQMQQRAYSIALFMTCAVTLFVFWLVNLALIPLDFISVAFRRMAKKQGELFELPLTGDAEIQDMTRSFNALVAQRQADDEALKRSEALLTRAELASKSGNWELDLRTQRMHASIGAIKIYGISEQDSDYSYIKEARLPEYSEHIDAAMKHLIEHGEPYDFEFKIRTKDTGEIKDIHSYAQYDKEHQVIFGVIQDVTERKQILNALEQETARRKLLFEKSNDGIALLNKEGRLIEWNQAFQSMLGYEHEEMDKLYVNDWEAKLSADDLDDIKNNLELGVLIVEATHRRKDGSTYDAEISVNGLMWDGQYYLFCLVRDITKRKEAEIALKESEARFRSVIEASPIPYAMNDQSMNIIYLNPAFIKTFGYTLEDIPHVDAWLQKAYPDARYQEQLMQKWQKHLSLKVMNENAEPVEANVCCKNGETRTVLVATQPLNQSDEGMFVVSFFDITSRKQSEEAQRLAATVFSHAREGILITDPAGIILDANQMFLEITGFSHEELIGSGVSLFRSGNQSPQFYQLMRQELNEKHYWQGEIWDRRKNGSVFPAMLTISAVCDESGAIQQFVALFSDITESKNHERQLEQMAHFDPLTRLPNRTLLADRLQLAMKNAIRNKLHIAVGYLDLDGFKPVNDHYGHEIGDKLLIAVADRIKGLLRDSDTIARIGGDEFVLVLPDLPEGEASAAMANRLIQAIEKPIQIDGIEIKISISLGITYFPQQELVDADQLLRQADHAMYQAKSSGKNRYCVFAETKQLKTAF